MQVDGKQIAFTGCTGCFLTNNDNRVAQLCHCRCTTVQRCWHSSARHLALVIQQCISGAGCNCLYQMDDVHWLVNKFTFRHGCKNLFRKDAKVH